MRKRILFLITDLDLGGAPIFVRDLALGLDKTRFEVAVAGLGGEGPIAEDLRHNNIPTWCLGARSIRDLWVFGKLGRLIHSFSPDILHCTLVHANLAGRFMGKLCNVPYIIATIQTAEQGSPWHLTAEKYTWHLSDMTVCVSPSVLQHVRKHCRVDPSRLCMIPNAVDTDRFSSAEPLDLLQEGIPTDKITLIFTGRLHPVKNLPVLIKAVAELKNRFNLQLIIVGYGPEEENLRNLINQLDLESRVHMVGPKRGIEHWLAAADIYVIPSKWEGLSFAALEAMAAGLPIIASNTAGLRDMIHNGKTGLLVTPGSIDELASAIATYIQNPQLRQKHSRRGQETILAHYSLKKMCNTYTELYLALSS